MNNIWQITRTKDLINIMNKCKNKFAIIGLTLKDTSNEQKILIKRFFKTKHIEYPNIIFIYYEVNDNELGKNINLLKNSKNDYPYIYHIYDVDKILVNVSNVNNDTINESFDKIKNYYDNDKLNSIEHELPLAKSAKVLENIDRKLGEKIVFLKDKSNEYTLEILEEIKRRKIIEKK